MLTLRTLHAKLDLTPLPGILLSLNSGSPYSPSNLSVKLPQAFLISSLLIPIKLPVLRKGFLQSLWLGVIGFRASSVCERRSFFPEFAAGDAGGYGRKWLRNKRKSTGPTDSACNLHEA